MLAVKDLEVLKSLAAILAIPLFAAAYISDGALQTIRDPILDWLRNSDMTTLKIIGWAAWVLVIVALVAFFLALIDFVITWLHVRTGDNFVMPWFGFAALTAGLFVLSVALPSLALPRSPLNPYWHLGLLAYGFSLIDRSTR